MAISNEIDLIPENDSVPKTNENLNQYVLPLDSTRPALIAYGDTAATQPFIL